MKSLRLEIVNEKAIRPCGNPFDVRPVEIRGYGTLHNDVHVIDTGLKILLEDEMTLDITSLVQDVFIMGWTMEDKLEILVRCPSGVEPSCSGFNAIHGDKPFARVCVVEKKPAEVRFVEFGKEGGRVITGEPKGVTNG